MEQIKQVQKQEGNIDEELLKQVINKVNYKVNEDRKLSQDESFIAGCNAYTKGNYEKSQQHLKAVLKGKDDQLALYAAVILTHNLLDQGEDLQAVSVVVDTLEILSAETYLKEKQTVTELMQLVVFVETGKSKVIESLDKVLKNNGKLESDTICELKNKVAVLYFYNGNYAKGLERFLEVVAQSEHMGNKYYGAKALVDIGIIYGALGNYQEAKNNFEKAMAIEIDNPEDSAFIKTYALVNLYESILYEGQYELVEIINERIMAYVDDLSVNLRESILIMNQIFLCNASIEKGDIKKAEETLEIIEGQMKEPERYSYLSAKSNHILLKAEMASLKGELQEALKLYDSLLQEEDVHFKKYVLKKLCEMLNEAEYYKEANAYENQLRNIYEEESLAINKDYSEYALYKYEHEKNLLEETSKKIKRYIIIVLSFIGLIFIAVAYSVKYNRLVTMNRQDGLTKSYNRRYFESIYKSLLGSSQPFSLIMFDIDHFKGINDTYGHLLGDEVIKKVVEISRTVASGKGNVFRYGGEEFIILIEGNLEKEAVHMAETLRKAIENYSWKDELQVTVSVGVAHTNNDNRDILKKVDQKLYLAKIQGRNQVID